jgi:hypothetical protein
MSILEPDLKACKKAFEAVLMEKSGRNLNAKTFWGFGCR